jgi:hypothetical protein
MEIESAFFYTQKIISVLLKDFDVFAWNSIKDERAPLDLLLRNVGAWGAPSPPVRDLRIRVVRRSRLGGNVVQ